MKLLSAILFATAGSAFAGSADLISLKSESLHPKIEYFDTTIVSNLTDGLIVQASGKEEWPAISFKAIDAPWNLRGSYKIKVDVTNLSSAPCYFGLRLDSKKKVDAVETPQHAQGFQLLDPAETRTIDVRLTTGEWVFSKPFPLVGMRRAPGIELMDVANIDRIQVFAGHVTSPQTFKVENIRLEGDVKQIDSKGFLPFIDTYGQYKHNDWPQKIKSDADFKKAIETEAADIAAYPSQTGLSKFGGWMRGPKLESTGFFRVEKVDGKWWFVDPEGYLFWSIGPTCMDPNFGYTGVQQREEYFENLPSEEGEFKRFYSNSTWAPHGFYQDKVPFKMFRFYQANLFRKYGKDWRKSFNEMSHKRLRSWGMNTIANWADQQMYLSDRTPYTANFWIRNNRVLEASAGYWGQFYDVFDPSFRKSIQSELKKLERETNDPWCIGFFVDNELSWGYDGMSLALETLSCPADQPAKKEFVNDLKTKYGEIEILNAAWGSSFVSWESLLESRQSPDVVRAAEDLKKFYRKTTDTYFSTIREELKKSAPNHLYLGCRFAWVNDAVALSATRYCDVVSYNKYTHTIRNLRLPNFEDRPIIIGEYHFGSSDQGHFHPGLQEGDTQKHRAEKFKAYVKSALDNPQLVGVHWFQYVDEHAAGRADEENYNVGLVDICDTPYQEMVQAMREVGSIMYENRNGRDK